MVSLNNYTHDFSTKHSRNKKHTILCHLPPGYGYPPSHVLFWGIRHFYPYFPFNVTTTAQQISSARQEIVHNCKNVNSPILGIVYLKYFTLISFEGRAYWGGQISSSPPLLTLGADVCGQSRDIVVGWATGDVEIREIPWWLDMNLDNEWNTNSVYHCISVYTLALDLVYLVTLGCCSQLYIVLYSVTICLHSWGQIGPFVIHSLWMPDVVQWSFANQLSICKLLVIIKMVWECRVSARMRSTKWRVIPLKAETKIYGEKQQLQDTCAANRVNVEGNHNVHRGSTTNVRLECLMW